MPQSSMKHDVLAQLADLLARPEGGAGLIDLGSLDTQQNDFTLDRQAGILYPAGRQLQLPHRELPIDHQALYQYIAQRAHTDLDTAQHRLMDFIEVQRALLMGEGIRLGPIGSLKLDAKDKLVYVIDTDHNLDPEYFGLPPITGVEPVLSSQERYATQPPPKESPIRPLTYWGLLRSSMDLKFMLVVVLLLLLNIPIVYYLKFVRPAAAPVVVVPPTDTLDDANAYINYDAPEPIKPTPEQPNPTPAIARDTVREAARPDSPKGNVPTTPAAEPTEKHLIVLGVFGSKANAESLQVTLFEQGYNPAVTQLPSGAYRVGVLVIGSADAVPAQLEKLRKTYKGAYWKQ